MYWFYWLAELHDDRDYTKQTGRAHMYLRRVFTTVYVGKMARSIDTHKDYVEGAGYSEHSVFIDMLQTPEKLESIGRGRKNTDRRPQHVKATAKAF